MKKLKLTIFYFDCWMRSKELGKSGRVTTKRIYAYDKEDATILFKAKYPEYGFDEPYS